MVCTRCGNKIENGHGPCLLCGTFQYPLCLAAPKKRRRWIPIAIICVVLVLVCVLSVVIAFNARPKTVNTGADDSTVPSACFRLEQGALVFDPEKYNGERILVVPALIDDEPVTHISENCFRDVAGFTTLLLPNTITSIGGSAFEGCADLRGVLMPEGVLHLGERAFYGCASLESLYVPLSLDQVGIDAFEACPKLSFIFYNGFYDTWINMYPQIITPFTWVSCLDGDHLHGANS